MKRSGMENRVVLFAVEGMLLVCDIQSFFELSVYTQDHHSDIRKREQGSE